MSLKRESQGKNVSKKLKVFLIGLVILITQMSSTGCSTARPEINIHPVCKGDTCCMSKTDLTELITNYNYCYQ